MSLLSASERVSRARAAQQTWGQTSVAMRCGALRRLRKAIVLRAEDIVAAVRQDTGKPALDALGGDVMVTLEQFRYYERRAVGILRDRHVSKPAILYAGARFEEIYEPHGVVLIYAPYNYPFQLALVPAISALVAGNAVILKCSERAPAVAKILAELFVAAELPSDLVQVGHEEPAAAAALLDAGPDMVFFTGSSEAGRKVSRRAGELLIPAALELGGKDPCLVFADCNLERTVDGVTYGAFANAGQVCVGIKRLYIEQSLYPTFLDKLIARVSKLRVSADADADLSPFPPSMAKERLNLQIEMAVRAGARVECPASKPLSVDAPVILSNVPPGCGLLSDEIFGPVLCVASFRDEEEAIALANSTPFALSSSIWTGDEGRGERIARRLRAGSCAVNDVISNIANPYASFGGNGMSGHGRYHGEQGLLTFSRIKSVMVMKNGRRKPRHWFPFTAATYKSLNLLLALRHGSSAVIAILNRFIPLLLCILCGGMVGR